MGVHAVISFATAQQTREIGVRMAFGADGGAIWRMVLGEGLTIVSAGLVGGVLGALLAARGMRSLLFDFDRGRSALPKS